jgi:hypothetical protein
MSIELKPLATAKIQLRPPIAIENGPYGSRQVFEVVSAEFTGRFSATLKGVACADWLLVSVEGVAILDIRGTLETPDGAIVYVNYYGKSDFSRGLVFPITIYVAPLRDQRSALRVAQQGPSGGEGDRRRDPDARLRVVRGRLSERRGGRGAGRVSGARSDSVGAALAAAGRSG